MSGGRRKFHVHKANCHVHVSSIDPAFRIPYGHFLRLVQLQAARMTGLLPRRERSAEHPGGIGLVRAREAARQREDAEQAGKPGQQARSAEQRPWSGSAGYLHGPARRTRPGEPAGACRQGSCPHHRGPDADGLFATEPDLSSPVIIEQARYELGMGIPRIRYCVGALPDVRGLVSTLRLKPLASRGQPDGRRVGRRPERC